MESLFLRTYRYRQRESKNQLENFTTEIFVFALEEDIYFRNRFFRFLKIDINDEYRFSTQQHYTQLGRPDIEIIGNETHIIIECKIAAKERENQLKDYLKILKKSKKKNIYLIYLTKFYEHKEISDKQVNYHNIKWVDINSLLEGSKNIVSLEFSKFLTEKNIAMDKNFNTVDLLSIENIGNSISKMDEVLDAIKPYFTKIFGTPSKDASRSTQLKNNAYYNYKNIGSPLKYIIDIGFQWWFDDDNNIYLTFRFYIPKKYDGAKEMFKFLKDKLFVYQWDFHKDENAYVVAQYLNINEISSTSDEHIPEMINFLKKHIDEIRELKKKHPENF